MNGTKYTDIGPFNPFPDSAQQFLRHGYYAAVTFLDMQVGRVLDYVESLGVLNDTVIVMMSDHGYHLGEQGIVATLLLPCLTLS